MSKERWGVTVVNCGKRGRTLNRFATAYRPEALREASTYSSIMDASVVRLVPKGTKAQRRVFDGELEKRSLAAPVNFYSVGQEVDLNWFDGIPVGTHVRIQVTVLPEKKVDRGVAEINTFYTPGAETFESRAKRSKP